MALLSFNGRFLRHPLYVTNSNYTVVISSESAGCLVMCFAQLVLS